jgi:peptidoglycan/LPS O-acetylase OafA/YrhL
MSSGSARLTYLDGLRRWAPVVVLLYHAFCDGFPPMPFAATTLRRFLPFNADIAVMLFFLISGFVLAVPYVGTAKRKTIPRLAVGRYFRLAIPIFAACALVELLLRIGWIEPLAARHPPFNTMLAFAPSVGHLLRFGLWDVFFDYAQRDSYIGPLWTMQIELAGSALVLGLQAVIGAWRWRDAAYLIIASVLLALNSFQALFVIGLLLSGHQSVLASKAFRRAAPLLLASAIVLPFVLPPAVITPAAMLLPICLLLAVAALPLARRLLTTRLSRVLGRLSFPLYLVHGPVLWVVGIPLATGRGPLATAGADLLIVIVSFAAAAAFAPANTAGIAVARWAGKLVAPVTSQSPALALRTVQD